MACQGGAPCEGVLIAAALSGSQDVFTTPSAVMCKTSAEFYAAAVESLRWRRKWDAGRGCDALATRAALLAWWGCVQVECSETHGLKAPGFQAL